MQDAMNMISDRKYSFAMLLLSIGYCLSALSLETDFNPANEKYYPFVLSVAMVILSVAMMIWPSRHSATWPDRRNLAKIGTIFCAILVYSLVLHKVGFLICASVLMGLCMWVFEAKRKWIFPVSVIVAISFYLIFDRLLGLALPSGILPF